MKMKRFLSLLLALVMSLSMAMPAFAAEPDEPGDPDEGIMPLAQLYSDNNINTNSGSYSPPFTTTPNNGQYLRIWFRNNGTERVLVRLWERGKATPSTYKTFDPGTSDDTFVYIIPTPDKACTFYLEFINNGATGERITGQAAAAQYPTFPMP